jgi:hypothetical protein
LAAINVRSPHRNRQRFRRISRSRKIVCAIRFQLEVENFKRPPPFNENFREIIELDGIAEALLPAGTGLAGIGDCNASPSKTRYLGKAWPTLPALRIAAADNWAALSSLIAATRFCPLAMRIAIPPDERLQA